MKALSRALLPLTLVSSLLGALVSTPSALAADATCEPITLDALNQLVEQARSKIFVVKYDDALERLKSAEAALPCATEAISREVLSNLYLYRGVASFNKHDEVRTLESFRQAVTVNRAVRWDDRFGQRPRELFIEAKEAALLAPKGSVRIPELAPGVVVYLDGEPTAAAMSIHLQPGQHLFQVKTEAAFVYAALFMVESEQEVVCAVPELYLAPKSAGVRSGSGQTQVTPQKDPPPPRPPREPFDMTRLRPVSYAVLGLGGLSFLGGAGSGVVSLMTRQALLDGDYYSNRESAEKDALLERQNLTTYVSYGCFGATALLGAGGAALFLLSRPSDPLSASLLWMPYVSPVGAGLSLSGSF